MAKVSVVERNKKRKCIVEKFAEKRKAFKAVIANLSASEEERWEAQSGLQQLPRNASPVRLRNRCRISGRPRGFYRKFGLAKTKFREAAMQGDIPGLTKASW